jgi:hypothetical protein
MIIIQVLSLMKEYKKKSHREMAIKMFVEALSRMEATDEIVKLLQDERREKMGLNLNEGKYMAEDEPVVHSHLTDRLNDDHPLAYEMVMCDMKREHGCKRSLHAANNECMTTWVEFAGLNVCARAFAMYVLEKSQGVLDIDEFVEFIKVEGKGLDRDAQKA